MIEEVFAHLSQGLVVLARLIVFLMFVPGLSFEVIPGRVRLLFALALSFPLTYCVPVQNLTVERFVIEIFLGCFLAHIIGVIDQY